jgi:DHA2 family methylenomycin A resistance protein-like MFS transporter
VALAPELTMAVIGSTASGRIMAHTGPRRPLLVGLLVGGAGLVSLTVVANHTSYGMLVVPLVASGLGVSVAMPAVTVAVMEAASLRRGGLAAGTLNAARQVGGVTGVALLGTLVAHRATFVSGLRLSMAIAGGAFCLAAVLTVMVVDRPTGYADEPTRPSRDSG